MPQFPHDWMAAIAGVVEAGWRISWLEAAHIASVEVRAISAARASTGGGSGLGAPPVGRPVGQRGPVGHCGAGLAGSAGARQTGWAT